MSWELVREALPSLPFLKLDPGQPLLWSYDFQQPPALSFPAKNIQVHELGWEAFISDGSKIILGAQPWGVLPDISRFLSSTEFKVFYLPYRGWHRGQWFDGPMIGWEQNQVKAYALPGGPLVLTESAETGADWNGWIEQRRAMAWKQSLALAFREKMVLQADRLYLLESLQSTLPHAIALLGLRLAFPEVDLASLQRPDSPPWKRYCQNLNVATWLAPAQAKEALPLSLDGLCSAWPLPPMHQFLLELQKQIPFVPGHILQQIKP